MIIRTKHELAKLPYSYKNGNNPCDENSHYYCHYCDLSLFGDEVGYVVAGSRYADCEMAKCPNCGEENSIFRTRGDTI